MSNRAIALCVGALWCGVRVFAAAPDSANLVKLNQIQVIGTHNSYHAGLAPSEAKLLEQKNPKLYQALEYRHRPLDAQFTSGVRQIGNSEDILGTVMAVWGALRPRRASSGRRAARRSSDRSSFRG